MIFAVINLSPLTVCINCSFFYIYYNSDLSVLVPSVLWHCWLGDRKGVWFLKTEWLGTGMVICLEEGANDLYMVQLMPLPTHHVLLY